MLIKGPVGFDLCKKNAKHSLDTAPLSQLPIGKTKIGDKNLTFPQAGTRQQVPGRRHDQYQALQGIAIV